MRQNKLMKCLITFALVLVSFQSSAQITFSFIYTDPAGVGFNDPTEGAARKAAMVQTGELLAAMIIAPSPATINISVNGAETGDDVLAAAGSNFNSNAAQTCQIGFHRGDVGLVALGNPDPNPAVADGTATVNFEDITWDLDDDISPGSFDFKSTMLHELLHAMGFSHSISAAGTDPCNTAPPDPGSWAPYDEHLGDTTGLMINSLFVLDDQKWQNAATGGAGSNGVLWRGPRGLAGNNGQPIPLFSPAQYSDGSSISHMDDAVYMGTKVMEAATDTGQGIRTLSDEEKGILEDIGYTIASSNPPTPSGEICFSPNAAIPDGMSSLVDTQQVTQTGTLTDLDVRIEATHTWVSDLSFSLLHVPSQTTVQLIDQPGIPASLDGCDGLNINVTLDDAAASSVEDACAQTDPTISGTLSPNQSLSAFNGQSLDGDWQLTVTDTLDSESGTLDRWCLVPTTDDAPPPNDDVIFDSSFESGEG